MANYKVIWEINIDGENPIAAAHEAREVQRDPESWASCFIVEDVDTGEKYSIDLMEPPEDQCLSITLAKEEE